MTKILIIEDEIPARNKLKRCIQLVDNTAQILAELDTAEKAIQFLQHTKPDLIFSDIELLDGNAFTIYEQVSITCPIIFITAYDQFWMSAFETNGIEYLLKPFSQERFQKAWDKFKRFSQQTTAPDNSILNQLTRLLEQNLREKEYKTRFTISSHRGIYFISALSISYFSANEGVLFAFDVDGKKHVLQESLLKELEPQLNPAHFFRINRSEIVNKQHIEKVTHYNKNALSIQMKGSREVLVTSQSHTSAFRKWVELP
jgi:DNA-binding LytR/AlgR family response regulator